VTEIPMRDAYSRGSRALAIVLRTAHVLTMAVFVGGLHLSAPEASVRIWRLLTVATGAALLVSEMLHSRHWVYQGRGVATILHVAVLALLAADGMGRAATTAALVVGSVGSHLPRSMRKWSLRHRRIVD